MTHFEHVTRPRLKQVGESLETKHKEWYCDPFVSSNNAHLPFPKNVTLFE